MKHSLFPAWAAAAVAMGLLLPSTALPAASAQLTGWASPEVLDTNSTHGLTNPQIATHPSEFAVAVWAQSGFPTSSVRGSLFVEGRWTSPTMLGIFDGGVLTWPDVAVDAIGRALAVWSFDLHVYASRFVPGAGWDVPTLLGWGTGPRVAMDPKGTGFVVSYAYEEGAYDQGSVWANRFVPGIGWESPALIDGECGGFATVAVDAQGNAVVGWSCHRTSTPMASRYTPEQGWETPIVFDGRAGWAEVATNAHGIAFLLWSSDPEPLRVSRYVPGTGWEAPSALLGDATAQISSVSLSAGGHGTAIAVWTELSRDGTLSRPSVFASHFDDDVGWQGPVVINDEAAANVMRHVRDVSVDPEGRGVVLWAEDDGTRMTMWANYHSRYSGWGKAVPISEPLSFASPRGYSSSFPAEVAMDREGRAIAVWGLTREGGTDIWVNRFVPTTLAHPDTDPGQAGTTVDSFDTVLLVLVATNAVFAAALVGLFVYSQALRQRHRWPGDKAADGASPDPRATGNGGAVIETVAPSRNAPSATPWRRWPANNGYLHLTAKERILLHLLDYARYSDSGEASPELTSNGIAHSVGIEQRHAAQYLRPLVKAAFVREKTARVRGVLQRRRIYLLDAEGWRCATGIRDRVVLFPVRLRDPGGTREATVSDVIAATRSHRKILDVVREAIETGVVDLGN